MRSCLTLSLGALALAQFTLATPFNDANIDSTDAALAGEKSSNDNIAVPSEETLADALTTTHGDHDARAPPTTSRSRTTKKPSKTSSLPRTTSFTAVPEDNANYGAFMTWQQDAWCKTAASTAPGYSRACIDGVVDSIFGRSAAPEDEQLAERAVTTSPIPWDNAGYAAMTKSQHSAWCKTAKTTAPGYSRACIDGFWDSLYRRTAAVGDASEEAEDLARRALSTSPIPWDNAGYAAMTKSQHSAWCKTAKTTAPGYSRACIDGHWDSLYRRTDLAEDNEPVATFTTAPSSSPATVEVAAHEITASTTTNNLLGRDAPAQKPDGGPVNYGRHVYLSSLRSACPSATDPAVVEKCSSISSWDARATGTGAAELTGVRNGTARGMGPGGRPGGGLGGKQQKPTTLATVTV